MLSEFLCPTCMVTGKIEHLQTTAGKPQLHCSQGHIFPDMEEFLASNPAKKALPEKAPKIQPGTSEFVVRIQDGLIEALGKRFGKRLDSSIGALLGVMLDPDAFVVASVDVKRLADCFGAKVVSSDSLVGSVRMLVNERNEWKQKAEQNGNAKAVSGDQAEMSGDYVQMTLRLSMDAFTMIQEKAKFNSMSFSQFVQTIVEMGIENKWV